MPVRARAGRPPSAPQEPAPARPSDPDPRAAEAGYARLACAVVHQALFDAAQPKRRGEVARSVESGAVGWWLEVAGIEGEAKRRACAAILERACRGGGQSR